jgi:two-component system OmpR family sensor kinase
MKLRTRLYIGLLAVAVTFAVSGYLVANTQRRYLTDQVDQQLRSAVPFAIGILTRGGAQPGGVTNDRGFPRPQSSNLSELFVGHLDTGGTLTPLLAPQLAKGEPIVTPAQATAAPTGPGAAPFTADGRGTDSRFRVVIVHRPDAEGWEVVALSLNRADSAYRRLLLASGLAALVVLGAIGLTAAWVVRLGVKPINDKTEAADAITAGDDQRRIRQYPSGTEAGRLSRALNTMLDERQAADERLRQFVSDASHELRTPLTSIRGYSDLYTQGGLHDSESLDDAMRRVSAEATRMGSIVDDLLLLSKLDRSRELNDDDVDLTGLLEDAARDVRAVQPERVITVSTPPSLPVVGDTYRLQQVLAALVHNALVHTPLDTAIELSGQLADDLVTVEVRDHGPGMDAESQAHAFERFYRGDPSRSRHTGGSGLGLAIAKSIVEAHGGRIAVHSEPGQGCRFIVTLPARTTRSSS